MSQALPGMHYCKNHQGNHSHYAEHNCEVCILEKENKQLVDRILELRQVIRSHESWLYSNEYPLSFTLVEPERKKLLDQINNANDLKLIERIKP